MKEKVKALCGNNKFFTSTQVRLYNYNKTCGAMELTAVNSCKETNYGIAGRNINSITESTKTATNLNCSALVRKWRVEESSDDIHNGHSDQVLQGSVCMFAIVSSIAHL